MKILMISRNPLLYSHQRLLEAAKARGHTLDIINTLQIYMSIKTGESQIKHQGTLLHDYDAIIPRIGASVTLYGLAVLRQFEYKGVWSLNSSDAIGRSRDKLQTMQLLSYHGIDLPTTTFAHSTQYTDDMLDMVGGVPAIIKVLEGTQGLGVVLGETRKSVRSVVEAFREANKHILIQEYIQEANSTDIRCFVIGDEVVAAIKRIGPNGDFRSNLHRGGTAVSEEITPEERSVATHSAQILGLKVCGVDILRSHRGPMVMEVNSSPGLEGIETTTKVDVAGKIIDYIEAHVEKVF